MRPLLPALLACLVLAPNVRAQGNTVARLEVFPHDRILHTPARTQQLTVIAHFTDGSKRDVTPLTMFVPSDPEVAQVTSTALVRFRIPGEVIIWCRYGTIVPIRLTLADTDVPWVDPPIHSDVDRHVFAKLKQLRIPPSELAPDVMFLRRAYIDTLGMRPTVDELARFLKDKRPDKRTRVIDELLERPEFAQRWAHYLVAPLGLHRARLAPKNGAAYLHWMGSQIRSDVPLDHAVRDMIRGVNVVTNFGPISFYSGGNQAEDWAIRTAHNFLGVRLECARCHTHLRGRWTADDFHGFNAFFAQVQVSTLSREPHPLEMTLLKTDREYWNRQTNQPVRPRFPGGGFAKIEPGQDRRVALADWLTARDNPFFARTLANRIWTNLVAKGISDPPEELHEMPFTSNDALLEHLTNELRNHKFSLKHLVRHIMNARVYQLSSIPTEHNKQEEHHFARAIVRHLDPEIVHDLLSQFTEVPLPIEGMPPGTRAIHVVEPSYYQRPRCRLSVCDADPDINLGSNLHILNGDPVQSMLKYPLNRIGRLLVAKRTDEQILDELALASRGEVLNGENRTLAMKIIAEAKSRRQAFEDLMWYFMHHRDFAIRR